MTAWAYLSTARASPAPARLFHSDASAVSLGVPSENSAECTIRDDSRSVFA
jgi:hypothetical protein